MSLVCGVGGLKGVLTSMWVELVHQMKDSSAGWGITILLSRWSHCGLLTERSQAEGNACEDGHVA